MSVMYGRWNFDGEPVDAVQLGKAGEMIACYGPDEERSFCGDGAAFLYRSFETSCEGMASQPYVMRSGAVLMWDGRLDNRRELVEQIRTELDFNSPDVNIVAAAYEQSGDRCFAGLKGDWALSIWDPKEQCLTLARDFMGVRPLYYARQNGAVVWSTILEPLVLLAGHSFAVREEYLAGWMLSFPAFQITPYEGIESVPPAGCICISRSSTRCSRYWDFNPTKRVRYRSDAAYDGHFLEAFRTSVRRRLRSSGPVLAELSGGVDSSSIVCLADRILAEGGAEAPRLDTVSYFDDSEPNWNEAPYFTQVEQQRGRTGCHIDVGSASDPECTESGSAFSLTPGSRRPRNRATQQFAAYLCADGIRVLLSGIGGDEMLGGVPNAIPELAGLLSRGHLRRFSTQLVAWALSSRKPAWALLGETVGAFLPARSGRAIMPDCLPSWLRLDVLVRNTGGVPGVRRRFRVCGPLPSFQDSLRTLDGLRRQLACSPLASDPPYEKRYPYLDRDLLEFLFAVPVEQLLAPNRRRLLMRRSLAGIVPEAILNRRRKAFVIHRPATGLLNQLPSLQARAVNLVEGLEPIIDRGILSKVLEDLPRSQSMPLLPLLRTFALEGWLRNLAQSGYWNGRIVRP